MSVRVRFAPSPTGTLHPGSLRTALINYLFAKKEHGTFILRVEDTDQERSQEHFLKEQLQCLHDLGLHWEEGPDNIHLKDIGDFKPYRQSQRMSVYMDHAKTLINKGKAYYCFLTEQEIEEQKEQAKFDKTPFRIISPWRNKNPDLALKEIEQGKKPVIRFKNPENKKNYLLNDLVRGEVNFPSDMIGDFILIRSTGQPVYNFSCPVDDHLMQISHVLRSEEHLANTLRQLMIFEAFDWDAPLYGHLSIILGEDKKKLSKRHGAISVTDLIRQGFLPEALLNFLALMGWNPKTEEEIFSLQDLINKFFLKGLNPSPGIFDVQKLRWINNQHLKQLHWDILWAKLTPFFKTLEESEPLKFPSSDKWRKQAAEKCRTAFSTLHEGAIFFSLLAENHYNIETKSLHTICEWDSTFQVLGLWEDSLKVLINIKEQEKAHNLSKGFSDREFSVKLFQQIDKKNQPDEYMDTETFVTISKAIQKYANIKGHFIFMPIRTAILGKIQGAELKIVVPLIRVKELLKRLQKLKEKIHTKK